MQPKKLGINFFGPIGSTDGIGKHSNKMLKLLKKNFNVDTFPLDRPFGLNKSNNKKYEITKELLKNSNNRINFFSFSSRWVPYYFKNISIKDLKLFYNIGYWATESSEYSEEWSNNFKYFNEIWTISDFALNTLSQKANIPILKIPYYDFNKNKRNKDPKKTFNFLNISNVYSDIERKNIFQIIKGFLNKYKNNKKVKLIMLVSNANLDKKLIRKLNNINSNNKNIEIITNFISDNNVKKLYEKSDAYISLHRSEGFGITIADAISYGVPIIVTAYSGNMDFCNPDYNLLVKYKLVKIGHERLRYRKEEMWAQPDQKDFEKKLVDVFKNHKKYLKLADAFRDILSKKISKNKIADLAKKRLVLISKEFDYQNNMYDRKIDKYIEAKNFYGI